MTILLKLCSCFSRRFTVFTLHSFSSTVLRVPLGQIYILILDISNNFAEMAWNSPKRVNFSFECNGRKAQIMNHVWSGSRENPSPSFVKSDTTNLGNIFHRCCYRNKFAQVIDNDLIRFHSYRVENSITCIQLYFDRICSLMSSL